GHRLEDDYCWPRSGDGGWYCDLIRPHVGNCGFVKRVADYERSEQEYQHKHKHKHNGRWGFHSIWHWSDWASAECCNLYEYEEERRNDREARVATHGVHVTGFHCALV